MSKSQAVVEKLISLSTERAERLTCLAQSRRLSEDQVVERALDILFALADLLDERTERQGLSFLSEAALERVWDNDKDAVYDHWRDLYDVPAG